VKRNNPVLAMICSSWDTGCRSSTTPSRSNNCRHDYL